jgi:N-acetylneuraminate synthase
MHPLPEIIAEIGVNYYDVAGRNGFTPVEAAKLMVRIAAESGIKVVKFQTYKAEKLAAESSPAYWSLKEEPTRSQRELFSKYDRLSIDDYRSIAEYCHLLNVEFLSTAFDTESVEELAPLLRRHKIASADITNIALISKIGSYRKPVLLSIGASTKEEVGAALNLLRECGVADITLLHCVLNYPTDTGKANLWKINSLRDEFPDVRVGYSDHTKFNLDVMTVAWLMGAEVIEKHFTLDKSWRGNDHYHAASPSDMSQLVTHFRNLQAIIGEMSEPWYDVAEEKARQFARRGVYLVEDVKQGEQLRPEDVVFLRPQKDGITPAEWFERLSRNERYSHDIKGGQLLLRSGFYEND